MTQLRELTDRELDAVCGGGFFWKSFNTINQNNTQVGFNIASGNFSIGGSNVVQVASNSASIN